MAHQESTKTIIYIKTALILDEQYKAKILPFDTCLSLSVDFMSETTRGREDIPR